MTERIGSVGYAPAPVPLSSSEIPRFLSEELNKIQAAIELVAMGHLDVTNTAPNKPRQGDVRYADGTNWNPGEGEGFYFYDSTGTWRKFLYVGATGAGLTWDTI